MVGAQRFLVDGEGALEERLGANILPSRLIQQREVVEWSGHSGMVGAQRFLVDGEGALVERLGANILPSRLIQQREVVEWSGHSGMVGAQRFIAEERRVRKECRSRDTTH